MNIHPDFSDFIACLKTHQVEFVIVGAYSLALMGYPRYTGDMDIWIKPSSSNAKALLRALADFGLKSLSISEEDILSGNVIQLGYAPVRIDLLTSLDGLTSEEIWSGRKNGKLNKYEVYFLGREAFIKNKKTIGRHKDLADIEALDK